MVDKVIPYQDGSGKGKLILNSPVVNSIKQGAPKSKKMGSTYRIAK